MRKLDEKGSLLIPLVLVSTLLLAALAFGFWAFAGRQDYKNNAESKIDEAVKDAEAALTIEKDAEAAEAAKRPYVVYTSPSTFGTMKISHPRTWSVYADEGGTNGAGALKGYMHPGYVPAETSSINYALRFEVLSQQYDQVLRQFDGPVRQGRAAVSGYRLPEVANVSGVRIEGELTGLKQGVLILLPLRDKTIKLWTEGQQFRADFEEILKQFTFIP